MNFGTMNSEMPLMPFRRAFDAGEHEMDDVLGQVVFAGGDEDLLAGDACRSRRLAEQPWCAAGRDRCRNAARSGSSCRSIRQTTIFGRYLLLELIRCRDGGSAP
jgi:hypothetical protein